MLNFSQNNSALTHTLADLISDAALQRATLQDHLTQLRPTLDKTDQAIETAHFIKTHYTKIVGALAAFVLFKAAQTVQNSQYGWLAALALQVWQKYKQEKS